MKKIFILILLALPVVASAQPASGSDSKGNIEVYAGYGLLSAPDLITGFSNIFTGALLPGMVKKIDSKGFGTVFGGIDYYAGNRFAVGAQYYYSSYESQYEMQNESTATLNTQYHTLLIRGKGIWVNNPSFQFYSALAAGPSFVKAVNDNDETKNSVVFAFQVSPIGIRVGNQIAFFLEGGFGYQGLVSAGLSARF